MVVSPGIIYGSDREYYGRFTEQGKLLASGAKSCGFPAETSFFLTKTAFPLVHSRRAPRKAGFASAATNITVAATDTTVALMNITVPPANIAVPPVNTKVAPNQEQHGSHHEHYGSSKEHSSNRHTHNGSLTGAFR